MFKNIDEYTVVELAAMTEADVLEKILPVEMMQRGIMKPDEPPKHEVRPVSKDLILWEVSCTDGSYSQHTFDSLFAEEDQAKGFAELKPIPRGYSDTEPKLRPTEYKIGKKAFYSLETKARHEVDIKLADKLYKENSKLYKENSKLWEAYEKQIGEYNDLYDELLYDELLSRWRAATSSMLHAQELKKKFEEYCVMTEGDRDIAMKFLAKSPAASNQDRFEQLLQLAGIEERPEGMEDQEDDS